MDIELKHKWHLNPNAWYIRLYLWTYKGEKWNIDFCKLFWAYLFMPVVLPLRIFIWPLVRLLLVVVDHSDRKVRERRRAKTNEAIARQRTDYVAPKPKKPSLGIRFLSGIGTGFVKLSFFVQNVWFRYGKAIVIVSIYAIAAAILAGIGIGIYLLSQVPTDEILEALADFSIIVGASLGGMIVAGLVIVGVLLGADAYKRRHPKKDRQMKFRKVIKQGFVAVKSNTCPEIILDDDIT